MNKCIYFEELIFCYTPDEIEGSPYWVDLWASINGYKIGLQIKPKTFNSASVSIYTGKSKLSQNKGHELFKEKFGGKVFVTTPVKGIFDKKTQNELKDEIDRLNNLDKGECFYWKQIIK
jgi:hypothetical protein